MSVFIDFLAYHNKTSRGPLPPLALWLTIAAVVAIAVVAVFFFWRKRKRLEGADRKGGIHIVPDPRVGAGAGGTIECPDCHMKWSDRVTRCPNCQRELFAAPGVGTLQSEEPGLGDGLSVGVIQHDISFGGNLAFREGERVSIEGKKPDPGRPDFKYVVYSDALGKRFRLSDMDVFT